MNSELNTTNREIAPADRRRRALALPALGLSALLLAGCGGTDDDASDTAPAAPAASSAAGDDASPSASSESSAADDASDDASDDATDDASDDATDDASDDATDDASGGASSGAAAGAAAGIPSDRAELEEVLSAAEGTLDGSTAVSIDDDERRGGWEVTVVAGTTEQEVLVSEDRSTEVIDSENDDFDIDPASVEVSLLDAVETASADQSGTVTDVSLDDDDDRAVWEIEFDDDLDVIVDGTSGEVVGQDR